MRQTVGIGAQDAWTQALKDLRCALEAGESVHAISAVDELETLLRQKRSGGAEAEEAWQDLRRFLQRRGYFVATPAELAASLAEIRAMGEGFDLFELARSMAAYDTTRTECLKLGPRLFPALKAFSPICSSGRHPEVDR